MRARLLPWLAAVAVLAAGCTSGGGAGNGGLDNGLPGRTSGAARSAEVVAAENTWGDVTAQIAGPALSVASIVDSPDEDPHEYESTVGDAALVAHARLVVRNGAGYDTFVDKLLGSGRSGHRAVVTVADVVGLKGTGVNPHLWYRASYVAAAARAITDQLIRIAPGDAATFRRNLATLLAGERRVTDVVAQIRARHAGEKVAYTEPVAAYLVQDAGLELGIPGSYPRAIEEGSDPSPLDDARFKHALAERSVRVLLYNAQVTDSSTQDVKRLAAKHGVPVVGVSELLPPAQPDLPSWQLSVAEQLLRALDG